MWLKADVRQFGLRLGGSQVHYRKKALAPCQKRDIVRECIQEKLFGISRVCQLIWISRSTFHYRSIKNNRQLAEKLEEFARQHPREGF